MADTDDVQGYNQKFENQRRLLKEADIDETDRREIHRFIAHYRANTSNNIGTAVGHLNHLRLSAERAEIPLTEMTKPDVDIFLTDVLDDEYGLADGSIRNYRKSLRVFFEYLGHEWWDEIKIGSSPKRKHDPDDEVTEEELDKLLDACDNPRDRALLALIADTGLRIGAVLSFQIQHVNFDRQRSTLTVNDEANVKGDDGAKPVTWSRSYVANWLSNHPRADNPEAALIHKMQGWDEDEEGALTQQYAARRISEIADRAGLDGDSFHAHQLRGTAISRWIREGMSDQAIKHRAGWSEDSRMFQIYSRVKDEELNDVVFDHYEIDGEREEPRQRLDKCPSCQSPLRGHETFCPACAHPLTSSAASDVDDVDEANFESAKKAENHRQVDYFTEFRRRFNSDAEFRAKLVGEDAHAESS